MHLTRITLLVFLWSGNTLLILGCLRVKEDRIPETGATLEGMIRFKGEIVPFAHVIIASDTGSASASVGTDGKYRIANAPLGVVKVAVNTESARGEYMSAMMSAGAYQGPKFKEKVKTISLKFVNVPEVYWDPSTTPLKTIIERGANTFDINIK